MSSMQNRFFLDRPGERLLHADALTWNCGKENEDPFGLDRDVRHEIFSAYPSALSNVLAREYRSTYEKEGRHAATWKIGLRQQSLADLKFNKIRHDDDIRDLARQAAHESTLVASDLPTSWAAECLHLVTHKYGITYPVCETLEGVLARLKCQIWWSRNLRRQYAQTMETASIRLNKVNRRTGLYVSDAGLRLRKTQKSRNRDLMSALKAVNELGESFSLEEIVDHSLSNPNVRRAELMCRIAGLESVARDQGHVGIFCTVTCPSRMHASFSRSCEKNPRYDGTSPRDAQEYLRKQWARARSKLDRKGIRPYGFRVAEPQHDGTPHWHFLLFVDSANRDELISVLGSYALQTDGNEPGAKLHRFTHTAIDWNKGSAAGYIAKYISKNIDGFGIDLDLHGKKASSSAERVDAWASIWGIRQFQQIGGPSVGVWRELRRIRESINESPLLDEARIAADEGNWAHYFDIQGSVNLRFRYQPLKLSKVWSDEPGQYGEAKGYVLTGISHGILTVETRLHTWVIQACNNLMEQEKLDRGEAGCGTRSGRPTPGRSLAGVEPLKPQPAGSPCQDFVAFNPLEFCQ